MTDEMKGFMRELVLLGVALSREGDSKRVLKSLDESQFESGIGRKTFAAIGSKDVEMVTRFLDMMGVARISSEETAVTAIIRETQIRSVARMEAELTAARNLMNRTMAVEAKA